MIKGDKKRQSDTALSADRVASYLLKSVNRAVRAFDLITPGDRIAVGVSGGKDSRTLLELLLRGVDIPPTAHPTSAENRVRPYDVVAVHIDGSGVGLPDLRPLLQPWFEALAVDYEIAPLKVSNDEPLPMDCFRCAWNRRKALFFTADHLDCNKVALGHHADDAVVTTLLSLLYKGQLETLDPNLSFFDGHFFVIRPLIYLSEGEISRYARACGWKLPPALQCSRSGTSRRGKIEQFLASFDKQERQQIRANLWHAAHR
jgi:tRNA 2-thiocytidine biosynthesis protein TtcA